MLHFQSFVYINYFIQHITTTTVLNNETSFFVIKIQIIIQLKINNNNINKNTIKKIKRTKYNKHFYQIIQIKPKSKMPLKFPPRITVGRTFHMVNTSLGFYIIELNSLKLTIKCII